MASRCTFTYFWALTADLARVQHGSTTGDSSSSTRGRGRGGTRNGSTQQSNQQPSREPSNQAKVNRHPWIGPVGENKSELVLLSDDQVKDFLFNGYLIIKVLPS